jgi:hypothetical protein
MPKQCVWPFEQVEFMEGLMQPDALCARILLWAEEQIKLSKLPPSSGRVLEAVLHRGSLLRSGVAGVVGASTRSAHNSFSQNFSF